MVGQADEADLTFLFRFDQRRIRAVRVIRVGNFGRIVHLIDINGIRLQLCQAFFQVREDTLACFGRCFRRQNDIFPNR